MAKYVLVVPSEPHAGRDDEYNEWYDSQHIHDICAIPGIVSGRRLTAEPVSPNKQPANYLALYEIETDSIEGVMQAMNERAVAGKMPLSDSLDLSTAQMWVYKQQ